MSETATAQRGRIVVAATPLPTIPALDLDDPRVERALMGVIAVLERERRLRLGGGDLAASMSTSYTNTESER